MSVNASKCAVALVGFSAAIGQIVLLREFMAVFNGNEISLGVMLATWLLWTAAGSSVSNRLTLRVRCLRVEVAVLECLLAISLLPTVWAVRASKAFFQTVPGELLGPAPMLLTCIACLSVFCVLSGYLFVAATKMYPGGLSAGRASSSAYLLEAAGSALGGILASLVLLHFLDSFQIATLVAVLNLWLAAVLMFRAMRKQLGAAILVLGLACFLFIYAVPQLRTSSQARLWQGFHLLKSRDSIYGNLAVTETGDIRSLYDNGVILASAPDEAAAEEAVHYALLEHAAPKRVLLIGGGANGSIGQILKHPDIERVDYVELDPMLIDMAQQFFPTQFAPLANDHRIHIHYADGRFYLRNANDQFDVIILNLPDPQTAQLNRFYTAEFFRSARDHLATGGLLALELGGSAEYISPERAELLRCIDLTLHQVFPQVSTIPGENIHFFAAMQTDVLIENPQILIERLRERNLQTLYVREYFIPFRMMPDRMAQIREMLQPLPTTPVNRDFEPIAYYFDVTLWSSQFKAGYSRWFRGAAEIAFPRIVEGTLVFLLIVTALLAYLPDRQQRAGCAAAFCVAAAGFTLMALQLFLLLAFQSVYGYVYHQFAILIGMFMAGIALGSWLGMGRNRARDDLPTMTTAAWIQFVFALSGLVLLVLISLMSHASGTPGTRLATEFAFPALAAASGILGGYQFAISTQIYLQDRRVRGFGTLYALDLLGGCAGALLLSSYLIPVFGFWKTAWLSAAVNLAPALLAGWVSLESRTTPA